MKITIQWLKRKKACNEAVNRFKKQKERNSIKILQILIRQNKLDWANWLIVRLMKYKQYINYAIYAAKQVINIYEKQYPDDDRPRKAIQAAKRCIKSPSKKNKIAAAHAYAYAHAHAAAHAAAAAYAAAYAAAAYAAAAYAAAYDADAAAYAAAAYDAAAAVYDADAAAYAADAAADDIRNKMKLKILKYGVKLLGRNK